MRGSLFILLAAIACSPENKIGIIDDTGIGPAPECGDGVLDEEEECDDGNLEDRDACTSECLEAFCGDGTARLDLGEGEEGFEACDDGNLDDEDACLSTCEEASCGDGIVRLDLDEDEEGFEACDDGNDENGDACLNSCEVAYCGDGFVRGDLNEDEEGFEACDDGNLDDSDGCLEGCVEATCGDGIVRLDRSEGEEGYEACDDGNTVEWDDCTSACEEGPTAFLLLHHTYDDLADPITDATGNGHDGHIPGPAISYLEETGPDGSAASMHFPDGQYGYYEVPTLAGYEWGEGLTVSLWIRWSGSSGDYRAVVGNGYHTGGSWEIRFGRESSGTKLNMLINTSDATSGGSVYLTSDEWHHVAMTYDGSYMRAYLDHNLEWENPLTGSINVHDRDLEVGRNADWDFEAYSGELDDLRIYTSALSEEQLPR